MFIFIQALHGNNQDLYLIPRNHFVINSKRRKYIKRGIRKFFNKLCQITYIYNVQFIEKCYQSILCCLDAGTDISSSYYKIHHVVCQNFAQVVLQNLYFGMMESMQKNVTQSINYIGHTAFTFASTETFLVQYLTKCDFLKILLVCTVHIICTYMKYVRLIDVLHYASYYFSLALHNVQYMINVSLQLDCSKRYANKDM